MTMTLGEWGMRSVSKIQSPKRGKKCTPRPTLDAYQPPLVLIRNQKLLGILLPYVGYIGNEPFTLSTYTFVSCRFNIPQKLSNSTLSVPCIQRTNISTLPLSLEPSWTLKPNAGSPPSLSLSEGASLAELCPSCCFLRRAARLHTLPLANPRPVAKIGRYRNFTPKGIKVSLIDRAQESTLLPFTVNVLSEGKGNKCLGSVDVPLAIFCEYRIS